MFPHNVSRILNGCIGSMEELNGTFLWVEICKYKKIKLDDMMKLAYESDPSRPLLDKIKCKKEALILFLGYAREKYGVNEAIEDSIVAPHQE